MRLGLRSVELSQLSNGVYGVAGYALVAELRRDEVCNISVVLCTFEILVTFPSSQLEFNKNSLICTPCSSSYSSGNLVDG